MRGSAAMKAEASVMVDRTVEQAWKFMTDMSNARKWSEGVIEVRWTSPGPLGIGTALEPRESFGNAPLSQRVIVHDPGRRLSLEHIGEPATRSVVTFSSESVEGRTRSTFTHSPLKLMGPCRLLEPLLIHCVR